MDALDQALCRACEIFLDADQPEDALDAELEKLLPDLIEAGYVSEEPWGDDSGWFLWRFTDAGVARGEELGCF